MITIITMPLSFACSRGVVLAYCHDIIMTATRNRRKGHGWITSEHTNQIPGQSFTMDA